MLFLKNKAYDSDFGMREMKARMVKTDTEFRAPNSFSVLTEEFGTLEGKQNFKIRFQLNFGIKMKFWKNIDLK